MKNLFLFFCLILCSCKQESLDCCDTPSIELDFSREGNFSFNWQGGLDSQFVRNSNYWWFGDSDLWHGDVKGCVFLKPAEEPGYCSDNYCNQDKNHIMKIECPWLNAAKKDDSTILISVKQNDTEKIRFIETYMGGYYAETGEYITGRLTIRQCPEPIKFSKEELLFSAGGGIDSIIVIANRDYQLNPFARIVGTLKNQGLIYREYYHPEHTIGPWFIIDVLEKNKIIFSVNKNESGEERSIYFTVDFENCGEEIHVIQSSE
jgi:hypothetical protein